MASPEAPAGNVADMAAAAQILFDAKIRVFGKVNEKITGNSEKSVRWIHSHGLDSGAGECPARYVTKGGRNTNRVK
jgi:hypothetical protein